MGEFCKGGRNNLHRIIKILLLVILAIGLYSNPAMGREDLYTVEPGDTLWDISVKHGVSIETIKELNNLESDFLPVGKKLILNNPEVYTSAVPVGQLEYYVKSGDTLTAIANLFSVSLEQLRAINNKYTDFLSIGEKLLIPAVTAIDSSTTVAHEVKNGDTLNSIAMQYGVGIDLIRKCNNLINDDIYVGDLIVIIKPEPPSRSGYGRRLEVIEKAAEFLGTPYLYGGQSRRGFDCSGLVKHVFSYFGQELPRTASDQYRVGISVERNNLMPGDLVFFCCGGNSVNHVGIYVGDNKFIHSSSPESGGVIYTSLDDSYYFKRYVGARRIMP
jgi:LysM repeat protein